MADGGDEKPGKKAPRAALGRWSGPSSGPRSWNDLADLDDETEAMSEDLIDLESLESGAPGPSILDFDVLFTRMRIDV